MEKPIIIGFTGPFGSGCTTAAKYLEKEKGFQYYPLSKWIKKICKKRKLFETRRNLQDIGNELREKYATPEKIYDYLVRVFLTELDILSKKSKSPSSVKKLTVKQVEEGNIQLKSASLEIVKNFHFDELLSNSIVIDGIRNHHEVETLRTVFRDKFILIAVDTDAEIRWERIKNKKNLEYFKKEYFQADDMRDSGEEEPPWGQQVTRCVAQADIIINNNFTRKEKLFNKLNRILNLIYGKEKFKPSVEERAMQVAQKIAQKSQCLKRKVGAVIIEEDKNGNMNVLGEGYNESPLGIPLCAQERKCHKENVRKCPNCGIPIEIILDKCINPSCVEKKVIFGREKKESLIRKLDLCRALHAEERAIINALKKDLDKIKGAVLFSTTFPCLICARVIIEVGIKKVIYIDPYPSTEGKKLFGRYRDKITIIKFEGVKSERLYDYLLTRNTKFKNEKTFNF